VKELLSKKRPDLLPLKLHIGCPEILKRRRVDERAYAHVGHKNGICIAEDASELEEGYIYGLLLHEVGHIGAAKDGWPEAEKSANDWVEAELGWKIIYRGQPPLEWIPIQH